MPADHRGPGALGWSSVVSWHAMMRNLATPTFHHAPVADHLPLFAPTHGSRWAAATIYCQASDMTDHRFGLWVAMLTHRLVAGGRITVVVEP